MGFSVSGSAAIIFAAAFIGFGMFHSATTNSFEAVSEAEQDSADRTLTRQNTAINVTSATWNGSTAELTVAVENTGASGLVAADVDVLADNRYLRDYDTSVDGDAQTDLWLSRETLTITVTSVASDPGRVKVVTGPGVAETATTEVV